MDERSCPLFRGTKCIQWNLSMADTIGTNTIVHYREGVLWSGVYYTCTLCGLYFSKFPL